MQAAGFVLTSVQFAALDAIAQQPAIDQATLAATISFDRATIGGVIERLESKGWHKLMDEVGEDSSAHFKKPGNKHHHQLRFRHIAHPPRCPPTRFAPAPLPPTRTPQSTPQTLS